MEISELCSDENFIRGDILFDVYRSNVLVNGTKMTCDITHISIPLPPEKEQLLKKWYEDQQLKWNRNEFYSFFSSCVKNDIKTNLEIQRQYKDDFSDPRNTSGAKYIRTLYIPEITRKPNGKGIDVYIVSDMAEPVRLAFFSDRGQISLLNLLQILKFATAALIALKKEDVFVGLSENNLYITYDECIKIKHYFFKDAETLRNYGKKAALLQNDYNGEEVGSDLQALGRVAWKWCTGSFYQDSVESSSLKSDAPDSETWNLILSLIMDYIKGTETAPNLGKRVVSIMKGIEGGNLDNLLFPAQPQFQQHEHYFSRSQKKLRECLGLFEYPYVNQTSVSEDSKNESISVITQQTQTTGTLGDCSGIMSKRIKSLDTDQVALHRITSKSSSPDWNLKKFKE